MTEVEKMLAGKIYDSSADGLTEKRARAHALCAKYNALLETQEEEREKVLSELVPDKGTDVYMQGPVYFDYGEYIHIGSRFFANFNFTVLDCCPVTIGDDVLIGPNCSIYTPVHPLRAPQRNIRKKPDGTFYDYEYAKPVVIGSNCWIAGSVSILAGVTIGEGCVIGAGSVVTRDIPPHSLAVGNPCRVLRKITEADDIEELIRK